MNDRRNRPRNRLSLEFLHFELVSWQVWWDRRFRVCPKGADYQWGKDPLE